MSVKGIKQALVRKKLTDKCHCLLKMELPTAQKQVKAMNTYKVGLNIRNPVATLLRTDIVTFSGHRPVFLD